MKRTGFKSRGQPLQAKTGMRKVSKKRTKRRASSEGQAALLYMVEVKKLPCCACGASAPSQAHHCRSNQMPRNDWNTIPLCYDCHQGPNGYHARKASWHAMHGPDYGFVSETRRIVKMFNKGIFDDYI